MENVKKVYQAIVNVAGSLSKVGIAKDKTCTQGATYKFRGIDDIYNALAPFLAENKLCILPRILTKSCVERTSAKGNALFYTTVEAEFDFVSSEDGSMHTVRTFGEAMDSGDKGCNKAMSAAYKYAAFQSFCIPTEGDNDTENVNHDVKGSGQQKEKKSFVKMSTLSEWKKRVEDSTIESYEHLVEWRKMNGPKIKATLPAENHAEFKAYLDGLFVKCPESDKMYLAAGCAAKTCSKGCPVLPEGEK